MLGPGIGLADIALRRDGEDLLVLIVDAAGVPVPGEEIRLADWTDEFKRVELLRLADGMEIDIGGFASFTLGTAGGDFIVGTNRSDFVHGGSGNDPGSGSGTGFIVGTAKVTGRSRSPAGTKVTAGSHSMRGRGRGRGRVGARTHAQGRAREARERRARVAA